MLEWLVGQWETLGSVALVTLAIYLTAVFAIRYLDRRALAQLSAFDFVVAVATGTIVGRTATTERPSWAQGAVALIVLLVAHRVLSRLRARSTNVYDLVERSPLLLVVDGRLQAAAMRQAHFTEADIYAELRGHGITDLAEVRIAMLEASGTVSVVRRSGTSRPGQAPDDR